MSNAQRPEPHVHGSWDDFAREMAKLRADNAELLRRLEVVRKTECYAKDAVCMCCVETIATLFDEPLPSEGKDHG